jgi:hypothetical protein
LKKYHASARDEVIRADSESEKDLEDNDEKADEDGTPDGDSKTLGTGAAAPSVFNLLASGKAFKTNPSSRCETSEEQHRLLRNDEQINGINKPLKLGPNVDGITPMIISMIMETMNVDELFSSSLHQSARTERLRRNI